MVGIVIAHNLENVHGNFGTMWNKEDKEGTAFIQNTFMKLQINISQASSPGPQDSGIASRFP